jgi:uncharacterized BrkB/YihY/UPF0761 family membrane protein
MIRHNSRSTQSTARVSNKALIFWITVAAGIAAVVALSYLREGQVPSPTRVWKLGAIGAALKYLLSFVGVFVTYRFAKSFRSRQPNSAELVQRTEAVTRSWNVDI